MQRKSTHQQLRDIQKKKDDEHSAKRFCKTCKKEISPAFHCACAGGGGPSSGSDSGGASGSSEKKDLPSSSSTEQKLDSSASSATNVLDEKTPSKSIQPALTPKLSVREMIADLIAKKLLTIDDNKGLCTLTIKCDPKSLTEAQRNAVKELVKIVLKELDDFQTKNKLTEKDCLVKLSKDKDGNIISLTINIPKKELYNQFIEKLKAQLEAQGLFIFSPPEKTQAKPFNPSPLSTRPKPPGFKE